MTKLRPTVGYAVGFLGLAVLLLTLGFHFWLAIARPDQRHDFLMIPLAVGAIIGFWGFYWVEPKRAAGGGTYILGAAERIQGMHLHRRAADGPPPADPPQVQWEHGTEDGVL